MRRDILAVSGCSGSMFFLLAVMLERETEFPVTFHTLTAMLAVTG